MTWPLRRFLSIHKGSCTTSKTIFRWQSQMNLIPLFLSALGLWLKASKRVNSSACWQLKKIRGLERKKRLDTEGTSHSPQKEEDRSTLSLPWISSVHYHNVWVQRWDWPCHSSPGRWRMGACLHWKGRHWVGLAHLDSEVSQFFSSWKMGTDVWNWSRKQGYLLVITKKGT